MNTLRIDHVFARPSRGRRPRFDLDNILATIVFVLLIVSIVAFARAKPARGGLVSFSRAINAHVECGDLCDSPVHERIR